MSGDTIRLKVFPKNFGCKTNFFDLFSIVGRLKRFCEVEFVGFEEADVVILNSCSVTFDAEKELLKWIKRCKRTKKKVMVTGCLPNLKDVEADVVMGAGTYGNISQDVVSAIATDSGHIGKVIIKKEKIENLNVPNDVIEKDIGELDPQVFPRSRAYIKIQEGCSRFCTFCAIPFTRGLPRFVSEDRVIAKIKELMEFGFREFVLVGTHLSLYGVEGGEQRGQSIKETVTLGKLTKRLAAELGSEKIKIGFSSLSPKEIDEDMLEGLELGRGIFSQHFHISVQSGSNRILKLMRRWYAFDDFLRDSEELLKIFPDACIGTDVIVGFPGETERDFEETIENLRKSQIGHLHVFPFSPRPRTPAFFMKRLPQSLVDQRTKIALELAIEKRRDFFRKFIGKKVELLVEDISEEFIEGTTVNYINVLIHPEKQVDVQRGEFILCEITDIVEQKSKLYALGKLCPPVS